MFPRLTAETLCQFRAVYAALAQTTSHSVLLDSCGWGGKTGGSYLMAFDPCQTVQLKGDTLWVDGLPHATIHTRQGLWEHLAFLFPVHADPPLPEAAFPGSFYDGWIGVIGYELNHLLEPSVPYRPLENPMGELYFARFRHRIIWQPETERLDFVSPDPAWISYARHLFANTDLASSQKILLDLPRQTPRMSFSQGAFEDQVQGIQEHIRAGDIYQANLSIRFERDAVSPEMLIPLYQTLVVRNPSPFSGVFWTPQGVIVSNSPERLIRYSASSNRLETRPIAGTRGRGKTPEEEAQIEAILQTDDKEQAEHLMLVDLERNDMGRVALPASVSVPQAFILERYSHVTHIVSQVEALKAPEKTVWEVLEAMFPGGTITGCPKVRCMEILAQCEPVPRGFYTGSLGYIDTRGNLDFNILIRSLFHWPDQRLHFHAGAGIVADSVPAWEYRECLRKAEAIQGVLSHDNLVHHLA